MVIVNEQKENVEMSDVAEEEVRNMKMTANLLK